MAKVYGHWITVNYRESYGIFCLLAASCSITNRRCRGKEFVTRKITDAVARIKLGLGANAAAGQSRRQARLGLCRRLRAGHVADAAAAPSRTITSIATGETQRVRELVEMAFGHAGLDWQKHVVVDAALFRPAEVDMLLRRRLQGEARPRLGAGGLVRAARANDGRCRLRARRRPPRTQSRLVDPSAVPLSLSPAAMKAVILAGGLGTRLSEETDVRPSRWSRSAAGPILWHIMKHLAHYDVARVHRRARL